MNKVVVALFSILLLTLVAGCSGVFGLGVQPTPIVITATPPAATAVAAATEAPTEVPTDATIPVATEIPTEVAQQPTAVPPTSAPVVQPTAVPPSPTVANPTPQPDGPCSYRATFLGDVTFPDNTVVPAGTVFVKTWRVRNDGTCTWGSAGFALHSLVRVGGTFGGPNDAVGIPNPTVNQGDVVDLSVALIAPTNPGTYRSDWELRVDNGPLVGVGASSVPLYAQIVVQSPFPTPTPTATPTVPNATRITFAPGATQAVVSGSLQVGVNKDYVIKLGQGQTMMLTLTAGVPNDVQLTVFGAQGINPQVIRANPDGSYWLGTLTATEDYIIRLTGLYAPTNYSLNVVVPQRIRFAPGATSATVSGTTNARRTVTYLLSASAGQTMTVNLTLSVNNAAALTIYGLTDGIPLVRDVTGQTSWTGQLPGTQDYVINVVPHVNGPFNFVLSTVVQ